MRSLCRVCVCVFFFFFFQALADCWQQFLSCCMFIHFCGHVFSVQFPGNSCIVNTASSVVTCLFVAIDMFTVLLPSNNRISSFHCSNFHPSYHHILNEYSLIVYDWLKMFIFLFLKTAWEELIDHQLLTEIISIYYTCTENKFLIFLHIACMILVGWF